MLASLCVETLNKLFHESGWKSLNQEQLFKTWQQIYYYFQSADFFTIQCIVESYIFLYRSESIIMIPLKIRMGILGLWGGNKTEETIKFLKSSRKKDIATIVEVHCHYILDCVSMFPNLKVLKLRHCRSNDELRCVSRECPLLEKVKCQNGVTDIGLEYLGDLTKLKDLSVRGKHLTTAGIVSFLKKTRTVMELFECSFNKLSDAVDDLASQNDVLPSMKYFGCQLSKLATTLKVFPFIKSLIVRISEESIDDDFIKLQHAIKTNETVKHLRIYGWIYSMYLGGSVSYNLLRSFNIIFPQLTSLDFCFREDGELISYYDAEADSSASIPFFRSVTRLNFECDITTGLLRTCMYPGNNIKHLKICDVHLFQHDEFRPYLRHLTLLEEIHLYCYHFCCVELIDHIVKLLPNLRVFRIDYHNIDPKALKMMLFTCSSNNRYGIQFFFHEQL